MKTKPAHLDPFATARQRGLITTGHHLPYDPRLVEHARELRKNMTPAEKKLWYQFLCRFRYRVLRQRPIDRYIVDFYCPQLSLVIELDGDSHFSEESKRADGQREAVLEGYGLRVVRFTNRDVLGNFDSVCAAISRVAEESPPAPLDKGGSAEEAVC